MLPTWFRQRQWISFVQGLAASEDRHCWSEFVRLVLNCNCKLRCATRWNEMGAVSCGQPTSRQQASNIIRHTSYLFCRSGFRASGIFFFCLLGLYLSGGFLALRCYHILTYSLFESAINWNCIIYFLNGFGCQHALGVAARELDESVSFNNNLHEHWVFHMMNGGINARGWTILNITYLLLRKSEIHKYFCLNRLKQKHGKKMNTVSSSTLDILSYFRET